MREHGGWSREAGRRRRRSRRSSPWRRCPSPSRRRRCEFKSGGEVLIIGPAEAALDWAERLVRSAGSQRARHRRRRRAAARARVPGVVRASVTALVGLARRVRGRVAPGEPDRPRALHALQRLHARLPGKRDRLRLPGRPRQVQGAPRLREGLRRDRRHRFLARRDRREASSSTWCSISRASRSFALHQLPQGYFAPGDDPLEQALAAQQARGAGRRVREAAASSATARRSARTAAPGKQGCNACIDVCSSGAIRADGDHVKVEPHLCAGCGGCATVCPSGAMTYAYPTVPDMGARLKAAARHLPRCRRQGRVHPVPRRARGARATLLALRPATARACRRA